MIANPAPFDATGHPAMSIPCGESDGLPIGVMLIGKHWDESTIYRAAHAFEQSDWAPDVTGSADRDPEERPGCAAAFPSARRVGGHSGP
jgi:Asp-tRNA(Asn)/Glu-tRNA(Gln) amidotransferase A subunit family amidase